MAVAVTTTFAVMLVVVMIVVAVPAELVDTDRLNGLRIQVGFEIRLRIGIQLQVGLWIGLVTGCRFACSDFVRRVLALSNTLTWFVRPTFKKGSEKPSAS